MSEAIYVNFLKFFPIKKIKTVYKDTYCVTEWNLQFFLIS